jgi:rhamnosyltransferase
MKRAITIGTTVYHSSETLLLRLKSAIDLGFSLYIFDNSPDESAVREFCKDNQNCNYFTCGKNVGLGFGISTICAQAYYDANPALIFFDQDTMFDESTLNFVESFYTHSSDLSQNYSAIIFNDKCLLEEPLNDPFKIKDVMMAISSGSLFFLDNLKKLNWHNENYFVDCVDYEFCLNSSNNHYKIGECSKTPGFDHESEQPDLKYSIFGKERLLRKYSVNRILDTTSASIKLFYTSIKTRNIRYTAVILRFLIRYLGWQFVARIINIFEPKKQVTI